MIQELYDMEEIKNSLQYVQKNEVTEGALQVWRTLPERIRHDPSLASFRQEHERLHGDILFDEDPLPTEDVVTTPTSETNNGPPLPMITINITNELGQVKDVEKKIPMILKLIKKM